MLIYVDSVMFCDDLC